MLLLTASVYVGNTATFTHPLCVRLSGAAAEGIVYSTSFTTASTGFPVGAAKVCRATSGSLGDLDKDYTLQYTLPVIASPVTVTVRLAGQRGCVCVCARLGWFL